MADSLAVRHAFQHASGCAICGFISSKICYRSLEKFLLKFYETAKEEDQYKTICTWTSRDLVISLRSYISVAGFGSESQFALLDPSS